MKSKIKKLINKVNNAGSSIILVVVALAFIGILVGSLLTAASALYKQKLYDYNAKDNFYYVEQAMDEIYANVGAQTVAEMQDAFSYTVDSMVYYDLDSKAYVTMKNEEANNRFKDKFMENISASTFFGNGNLVASLRRCISNDTVTLDDTKLSVVKYDESGNIINSGSTAKVFKIVIKNVTLTRTADYERSKASGEYTQTISTDIEIARPDFTVDFNTLAPGYNTVFDYALIADNGVEISQNPSDAVTIKGNIYAAADYYNKDYDNYAGGKTFDKFTNVEAGGDANAEGKYTFDINKVTSKVYSADQNASTMYNTLYATRNNGIKLYYDGINENSMYSGLMVKGSNVSILADKVIVPGSVSILDSGNLSIYGKTGNNVAQASVWCDNVVLAGSSRKVNSSVGDGITTTYEGAKATFRANMFVKDDLQLDADGSAFSLFGSYYGYGNSTLADKRTFVPTVKAEDFQYYTDANKTNTENRGHYNSSAIIVNGQNSVLDLSKASKLYVAGRSYIEMSKSTTETTQNELDANSNATGNEITTKTYTYDASIKDYKTGESISLKTNQLAYIPANYVGTPSGPKTVNISGGATLEYYLINLPDTLKNASIFKDYFPVDNTGATVIPCFKQNVSGKDYYYYSFEAAYALRSVGSDPHNLGRYSSADELAKAFIIAYVAELQDVNSAIRDYLVDISKYEDYAAGDIILPDTNISSNQVYSSGAVTAKNGTTFSVVSDNDIFSPDSKEVEGSTSNTSSTTSGVLDLAKDLSKHYNYVKWNLEDLSVGSFDANYIDEYVNDNAYGESAITPINTYFDFSNIETATFIHPGNSLYSSQGSVLDLSSDYKVWVSNNDVIISEEDADSEGTVRGIVFTKGSVFFDADVKKFEGMVVAGDKIFIYNNITTISSNQEICKAIIRECQYDGSENAKKVLSIFKGYESALDAGKADTSTKSIDTIDYSDVVRYNNWRKNVE